MEYKIKLTKEGRGQALSNLLESFAALKLSGGITGIEQVTMEKDSAEAVITFEPDALVAHAVRTGFKVLALDINDFASVAIEAVPAKVVPPASRPKTKKAKKPKAKKS